MKVSILTLGCKANQSESFHIESGLRAAGWGIVGLEENPDYCIINTCTVTSKSDYQSRQLIRRASRSGSRVIVTGCYSELNREAVLGMQGVERVVDIDKKDTITGILTSDLSSTTLCYSSSSRSRFFLKIQDGCNYSCSYCVIPRARGKSRSVEVETVLRKIEEISETYSEVVLTGIHLGTYGYDLTYKASLSMLISSILFKTTIQRIRLSSLEIGEVDDRLLELLQEKRLCSHLHVPVQSGDDRILGLMKRNYTTGAFLKRVAAIYRRMPDVAIGTDVIAGFPGEGMQEFDNTVKFLEAVEFSYIHVFPYSPRPGTPAAKMPDRVAPATAKERCALLRALGARKKKAFTHAQIGKNLDLLVEETTRDGYAVGTTGNYLKVRASLEGGAQKKIVLVRIAGVQGDVLTGVPILSA